MGYVKEYQDRILSKAKVDFDPGAVILDIGCGEGWHSFIFSKEAKMVVGMDIDISSVWQKIRSSNVGFINATAYSLPFKDETFDGIYLKDVLHHVDDPSRALKEIMRVTKEGGKIYFIEANRFNPLLYIHLTLMAGHQHFTQRYFIDLVNKHAGNAEFLFKEIHALPVKSKAIRNIFYFFEDFVEKILFLRKILAYNIAIIIKQ